VRVAPDGKLHFENASPALKLFVLRVKAVQDYFGPRRQRSFYAALGRAGKRLNAATGTKPDGFAYRDLVVLFLNAETQKCVERDERRWKHAHRARRAA
jgi:hypothetical protein